MIRPNRSPVHAAALATVLTAAMAGLSACDEPQSAPPAEPAPAEPVVEAAEPEPQAEPQPAPPPSDAPLPSESRSSEQSVEPTSETLFY